MKKLKIKRFSVSCPNCEFSAGARDRKQTHVFLSQNQGICFSLTGASDQNGIIYLISVLQVSKLSPWGRSINLFKFSLQEITAVTSNSVLSASQVHALSYTSLLPYCLSMAWDSSRRVSGQPWAWKTLWVVAIFKGHFPIPHSSFWPWATRFPVVQSTVGDVEIPVVSWMLIPPKDRYPS